MISSVSPGADCTATNIDHLPAGFVPVGYSTGTSDIRWTSAEFSSHPGAVRICQDSGASDATADVLDVERFAATNAEAPGWVIRARNSIASRARIGQRRLPLIYTSASNVTPLVNSLIAGGVTRGCGLFVANWNLTDPQAVNDVRNASGPFPIEAVQYHSDEFFDLDELSAAWLANVVSEYHQHVTNGIETLGELARSRNMQPVEWVAHQGRLDELDAERLVGASLPPAGLIWLSVNP